MNSNSQKLIQLTFLILLCGGGGIGLFYQISSITNSNPFPDSILPTNPDVKIQNLTQGIINSNENNIFYWIQVSDIHANSQKEFENNDALDRFCNAITTTLQPAFVLCTGDNVESENDNQNKEDFQIYNQTLAKYNISSEFWYSILGNHDGYDASLNRSLFATYIQNETQYAVDFNTGFGIYRFYMLDSTQKYGISGFLNLYGEMDTNKLDNFEGLINANPNIPINESVVAFHHPINEVFSEESSTGENFETLLEATKAQYVLNGHIHYENLYVNRESYNEVQVPSLKTRNFYRICAFDNDLMSFSDVVVNRYPQVVITNPTDARFYTNNMNLDRMITEQEIRTLIFDNSSIISAYATIDGQVIGNLTDQGQNLWTVSYQPQDYATGTHHLTVYIESANGVVIKEQDFQLSNFSATPIESSLILIYYKAPLYQLILLLVVIIIVCGLFRLCFPYVVNLKRTHKNQPPKYDPETLPSSRSMITIIGLYIFAFSAPVIIGTLNSTTLGAIFFSHIAVPNGYILDMESYLLAGIFMILTGILTDFMFRLNNPHSKPVCRKISVGIYFLLLLGLVGYGVTQFKWTLLLSPSIYTFILAPVYLLIEKKIKR